MEKALRATQSVLSTTSNRWLELTQQLPTNLLDLPPKAGEWSAIECLLHLIDTERWVFPVRVRAFLAGQDFPAFDPDTQGSKPSSDQQPLVLAQEFAHMRQESLELLATLQPADLNRTAVHHELGLVTLSELINEWAAHDLMHTVQAEQAMMQPFIRDCGPWDVYFKAHRVSD